MEKVWVGIVGLSLWAIIWHCLASCVEVWGSGVEVATAPSTMVTTVPSSAVVLLRFEAPLVGLLSLALLILRLFVV